MLVGAFEGAPEGALFDFDPLYLDIICGELISYDRTSEAGARKGLALAGTEVAGANNVDLERVGVLIG